VAISGAKKRLVGNAVMTGSKQKNPGNRGAAG